MLMEINTKETGKLVKDMDKEFMNIQMGIFMMENGAMISRMVKEDWRWQLEINTKGNGDKVKRMVLVYTFLQMAMFTKGNFQMEIDKEKVVILGLTRVIIKGSGKPIK